MILISLLSTIVGGDPFLNCICNFCIDVLSWAVTPYLTVIPFCVDLSRAVTPQLTAIPFLDDPLWAVIPVFSVAIINSDTTSTAMTLYLLSWEATPNFWHFSAQVLSWAVTP